jgi:hypothetical protein
VISDAVFSAAVGCPIKWIYNASHRLTRPVKRTPASVAWWRLVHHLSGELGLPLSDAERAADTLLASGISPGRVRLRSTDDESVAIVVDLPRFLDATALSLAGAIYGTPVRGRGRPRRDRHPATGGKFTAAELALIASRRALTPDQRLDAADVKDTLVALCRSGVPFVVVGAAAAAIHGAPWPVTEVDVVVDAGRRYATPLAECVTELRAHPRCPEWRDGFAIDAQLIRASRVLALETGRLAITIHTTLPHLGDHAAVVRHADPVMISGYPVHVLRLGELGAAGPLQPAGDDDDRTQRWMKVRAFSAVVTEDSPLKS